MWIVNHFEGEGVIAHTRTKEAALSIVRNIFALQVELGEIDQEDMDFYLDHIDKYEDGGGYAVYPMR